MIARSIIGFSLTAVLATFVAGAAGAVEIGDADRGAKLFAKCKTCHMVGPEARNRVGPHLNELFGRKAAGLDGYRYSKDMLRAGADGLVWTTDKLHIYIENPKALVTGTRMSFRGMTDAGERRDLLAYLRQFTVGPQDIPESEPTAAPTDHDIDPAILAIAGDRDYGEYLSSECTTCHQADGSDAGMPSITGWPVEDFVVVMHAYKSKARPHPVMQMMASRLSDEEIASLAVFFQGVE
jgi:cytochrome c